METTIKPELIAVGEPQEIKVSLAPFNKAKEQVGLTVTELQRFVSITSKEQLADALDILKIASKVEKAIEAKRKELVKPFNDGSTAITAHAKEITSGLPGAILSVKNAVLAFQKAEEERALELQKQARIKQFESMGFALNADKTGYVNENVFSSIHNLGYDDRNWQATVADLQRRLAEQETAKLQAQKEEDADLFDLLGLDEVVEPPVIAAPAPSTAYFAPPKLNGAAKVWKFEITDASLVPREYLIVNETAIRYAMNAGTRDIPGVRMYQEETLRIR